LDVSRPPKRKLPPLPKAPHKNLPIRPYDITNEETERVAKEHHEAQKRKKKPKPPSVYTDKQIKYANYFLTLPSQYDLHHKPDDYVCTMQKTKKSKATSGASGRKSKKSASEKRTYVPHLGEHANKIDPTTQGVIRTSSPLVQHQNL
jgi:16S rRNA U516 pseudouridylate synthase RsuA-like enzyme